MKAKRIKGKKEKAIFQVKKWKKMNLHMKEKRKRNNEWIK